MYGRATWVEGTLDQIEAGIARYRDQLLPALDQVPGYLGAALLVDRGTGAGIGVTYWDSRESMQASEEAGTQLRAQATEGGTSVIDIDRFELLLQERRGEPQANTFVRVHDARVAPTRVDEFTKLTRERAVPVLKGENGFKAALLGANRETGRVLVSTVWESAEAREASNAAIADIRREIIEATGAEGVKVGLYESAVVQIKQAALTG
jgi:heme-degrading monooxygenase HmoA